MFYIGKIRGTKLFVHWTFLIMIVLVFYSYYQNEHRLEDAFMGVFFLLCLFICITLHELGHIRVAAVFGHRAKNITLLPFGGVAAMDSIPEKPLQEFYMAIAGPVVSFAIAAILYAVLLLTRGPQDFHPVTLVARGEFIYALMIANFSLAVFNLIPAFPLDGGRIFRSLLALRTGRERATRIAAVTGKIVAAGFVITGFYFNPWLIFIGIFVFFGAGAETTAELISRILRNYTVKDVVIHNYTTLAPGQTLGDAAHELINGNEDTFLVTENGAVLGVLPLAGLIRGLKEHGENTAVRDVMNKMFLAPDASADLADTLQQLSAAQQDFCPVYSAGKLAGVISVKHITDFILVKESMLFRGKNEATR